MARLMGAFFVVLGILCLVAPASAQISGHPFEISGGAGYFAPDVRAHQKGGIGYTAGLGWRAQPHLTLEGHGTWAPSDADTLPNQPRNFCLLGMDLRWNLRPAESQLVPYILTGAGYGLSTNTGGPAPDRLARGAGSLGLGLLVNTFDQRCYLRLQVHDIMFRERDQNEFSNHVATTVGLQWVWGSKPKDLDLDGVRDWLDKCPGTPLGAKVDANGCPIDSDRDGVFDGLDKCENSIAGCTIDKDGCSADPDGDGVCNGIDTCPDTPAGATVNATGCPSDTDGDGVLDGIDKCNDTPKGATIDATGCQHDADGDGIFDGLDQCPNTPEGLRVDPRGCPIEVSEKETQLLDTGTIRIQNINFDTGKATIKPESYPVIEEVARILQQYPTLVIEIGGHTDNVGTPAKNDVLSQERADSVLAYMRAKFPGLNAAQYTAKGYGLSRPVAPNITELGRAKNRRVEFRVTNTAELRIERERRRFLRKDEGTPAVPPQSPPAPEIPTTSAPADTTKK